MLGDWVKLRVEALAFKGKLKMYSSETRREWKNKIDFEKLLTMEVKNWFSSNHTPLIFLEELEVNSSSEKGYRMNYYIIEH